jgi:ABC-type Mn2+/Zn2+ transport system permease subunit
MYLAGWLLALVLSLVGVLVVARDQIFIGVAVSQASTLGIACGLRLFSGFGLSQMTGWHEDVWLSLMAVVFAVLAALLTARGHMIGGESHEALTGWVFLASASVAILLVAHSPHGLEEVQRLLASSIIGATAIDVWLFGGLAALTVLMVVFLHRQVLLFALDPAMATAVGMRTSRWAVMTAAWLGLLIGLSMRVSGILYTFGHLVLPALIAKNLCREVKTAFWLAPCLTVSASVVGFVIANHWDYPPAQMTVALLSLMLALTWVRRRWRERKTLTVVDSQSAGLGISVQSGAPYQGKDKEGIQKI